MGYPDNAIYAIVGYVVTTSILVGYAVVLFLRTRKEQRAQR